jgi:hypothetical protein
MSNEFPVRLVEHIGTYRTLWILRREYVQQFEYNARYLLPILHDAFKTFVNSNLSGTAPLAVTMLPIGTEHSLNTV